MAPSAADAPTMISGMMFGRMCCQRMRRVDAPLASAARMNSEPPQRQHLRADEARAADPAEQREHAEDQEVVGEPGRTSGRASGCRPRSCPTQSSKRGRSVAVIRMSIGRPGIDAEDLARAVDQRVGPRRRDSRRACRASPAAGRSRSASVASVTIGRGARGVDVAAQHVAAEAVGPERVRPATARGTTASRFCSA